MTRVLKLIFELANGKSMTWSLADPRNDLVKTDVYTVINMILDADFLDVGGVEATDIKDAYIYQTQKIELT